MNELSQLANIANVAEIIGVLIVVGGVFFAVLQMRQIRQQRREMAAIELFRFFGKPEFAEAYYRVLNLPDGLNKDALRADNNNVESCAMLISTTMENIGVMVFHRIVPSVVVKNLVGTSAIILWRKLEHWIADLRVDLNNPAAFEWFEWLALVLDAMDDDDMPPAYIQHKNWKPLRQTRDL